MNQQKNIPLAIVIAGLIIAAALYFRAPAPAPTTIPSTPEGQTQGPSKALLAKLKPIDPQEHIRGGTASLSTAKATLVEFSDLECPFCKVFHQSLLQVIAKYGNDKMAWVYRHFPLSQHPKAKPEAEASECVNKLGGNEKFWQFVDGVFAITPSNNGLDPAKLPQIATEIGVDVKQFNDCLKSGEFAKKVQDQSQDGTNVGVDGTPFPILLYGNGKKFLLFREPIPTDLDPVTKSMIDDLYQFQQANLAKLQG